MQMRWVLGAGDSSSRESVYLRFPESFPLKVLRVGHEWTQSRPFSIQRFAFAAGAAPGNAAALAFKAVAAFFVC